MNCVTEVQKKLRISQFQLVFYQLIVMILLRHQLLMITFSHYYAIL